VHVVSVSAAQLVVAALAAQLVVSSSRLRALSTDRAQGPSASINPLPVTSREMPR
jgi:hypothetical protein